MFSLDYAHSDIHTHTHTHPLWHTYTHPHTHTYIYIYKYIHLISHPDFAKFVIRVIISSESWARTVPVRGGAGVKPTPPSPRPVPHNNPNSHPGNWNWGNRTQSWTCYVDRDYTQLLVCNLFTIHIVLGGLQLIHRSNCKFFIMTLRILAKHKKIWSVQFNVR